MYHYKETSLPGARRTIRYEQLRIEGHPPIQIALQLPKPVELVHDRVHHPTLIPDFPEGIVGHI